MSFSRRAFLGAAGLSALGLTGKAAIDAFALQPPHEPASTPAGTRWAMVIDPKKCLEAGDCTACLDACHRTHNVPAIDNRAHEVKWIWKESFEHAFPSLQTDYPPDALRDKPVMVLCNHCDNPPCVRVCPTQATWKRSDGIVMMDWHRCIGCRYCVAACPYGSRSFNWSDPRPSIAQITPDFPTRSKGVVEKCTFCEERIARDEPPACVAACHAKALVFGNLNDPESDVRSLLRSHFTLRRKPELGTRPAIYYIV